MSLRSLSTKRIFDGEFMKPDYLIEEHHGIQLIKFPHFIAAGLKTHGITTRFGGVSAGPLASLNMGRRAVDSAENIIENHRRVAETLGVSPGSFVYSDQVHGARIREVNRENLAEPILETDGLMTDIPGVTLVTLYADCMPIMIYDSEHRAIGMAHAGWRGTAQEIGPKLVRAMADRYGSRPETLLAALGPAIGTCCFEVGDEVVSAFEAMVQLKDHKHWLHWQSGKPHVDLALINTVLLTGAGVDPKAIIDTSLCTRCNPDLLYSHRRDHGSTGRMAALMAIQE
jgi:YfiH family protein